MNEEQEVLWYFFRERAYQLLRLHGSSQPDTTLLVAITQLPSFDNSIDWQIYYQSTSEKYLVTRREWLMEQDLIKFENPISNLKYKFQQVKPSFHNSEIELSDSIIVDVKRLLETEITLPVKISDRSFGTDGTSFELKFGDGFAYLTIHWWGYGPAAWRPITELTINIIDKLESSFSAK
jgi:hypothetical protein